MTETVYKAGRDNGGKSMLHAREDCFQLTDARQVYPKDLSVFPEWYIEKKACGSCWE